MTRQTSVQITEATDAQVEYLKQRGFGGMTDVIRIAIDRMAREEQGVTTKNASKRIAYVTDNWGREDVTYLEILWNSETLTMTISDDRITLTGPQFDLDKTNYANRVDLVAV